MRRLPLLVVAIAVATGVGAACPGWARDAGTSKRELDRLHLDDVHVVSPRDGVVEVHLRALASDGEPLAGVRASDLEIRQDGRRVDPTGVAVAPLSDDEQGVAVVLAIDVSRTMGKVLPQVGEAALRFVDELRPQDRVAVLTIAGRSRVLVPFDSSRAEARTQLRSLAVASESLSTRLHDGLYAAVELLRATPELPRRAFVVAFSDGRDGGSGHSLDEVIALANGGGSQARVLVFTIGYRGFGDRGLPGLRRLAEETNARFLPAGSDSLLQEFYDAIRREMLQSLIARFEAPMDGAAHTIEVSLGGHQQVREVSYPAPTSRDWPLWLALLGLGAAAAGGAVWARPRRVGQLVVVDGDAAIDLLRGRVTIGALASNDLVLDRPTISRNHAAVLVEKGKARIEDLSSTNGTFVNDRRVESSMLEPGDRIRLGDIELRYQA
ncbi:MAG: FHA domain-containing protein [Proteobacteria bacterium]|nr:FHA domain-containing protein [Pseudomonadota bacterium]